MIKVNITYTPEYIITNIIAHKTELQITKIHLNKSKQIYITKIFIPPRDTTSQDNTTED